MFEIFKLIGNSKFNLKIHAISVYVGGLIFKKAKVHVFPTFELCSNFARTVIILPSYTGLLYSNLTYMEVMYVACVFCI